MCHTDLIHPIPIPPVSVVLIDDTKAHFIHPTIKTIQEIPSKKQRERIQERLGERMIGEHHPDIIDEKMNVRQVLSYLVSTFVPEGSYCLVKEVFSQTILGTIFEDTPSDLYEILKQDKRIPKYSGWSHQIAPRGPFVFQMVLHDRPTLHCFPSKDKQLSERMVADLQDATKRFYLEVQNVKTNVPCKSATVLHSSFQGMLQDKPNLIYISNSLSLTNEMPCIVYRPTLNELQTKAKVYMPRIHSMWPKEEVQTLLTTTAISIDNKFTTIQRRGLFIWFQIDWKHIGTTEGVVQEQLENGDVLVIETKTNATLVVPASQSSSTKPLRDTRVRVGKPIWALLHIHPKGYVSLKCPECDPIKVNALKQRIATILLLDSDGWKSDHHVVSYTITHPYSKEHSVAMLNTIHRLKTYFVEKRDMIPIGNSVKWFSEDQQKWIKGTIHSYPDIHSYLIQTTKGRKQVPWTYVKVDKRETSKNIISMWMERVNGRQFSHPITTHIVELRDKGYSISDIQLNLKQVFGIESQLSLALILESLEMSLKGDPGVSVEIPIIPNELKEITIKFHGRQLSDILYTFRVIQVLIQLAEKRRASKVVATEIIEEDELPPLSESDMEEDDNDSLFGDFHLDDIDIDEEVERVREGIVEDSTDGESHTPQTDVSIAFTANLSIFLQSLYDKDPSLFSWQSRSNRKDRYTTICQEHSRHPKLMTNETKIEVDLNHPGAYGLSSFAEAAGDKEATEALQSSEKSCDGVSEIVHKGESCVALYHGSGSNKSWYICPRIYDLLENKPLRLQDLDFETPFIPKGWKKGDWRIDTRGRDITQFGPTYKGRGLVRNLKQSDYNEYSLYISPNTAQYFYPGFLATSAHPQLLSMPCCFISPNKRLEELYGIQDPKKAGSQNYIQGWKKTLGWDPPRLGVIPPILRPYFNLHPEQYKTGFVNKDQKGHPLWLRRGLPYTPNPFVSCLANAVDDATTDIDIRKHVLDHLTHTVYSQMNGGLMNAIVFSMDVYKNHLLFDSNLSWFDILDAYCLTYTKREVWILLDATDPLRPNLIHTAQATYHESLLRKLYILQRRKPEEAREWKVFFALRTSLSWEPIYRVKPLKNSYDIIRGLPGNHPQAIEWVQQRVQKVHSIETIPRLMSDIRSKQASFATPDDYMMWFETRNQNLIDVSPVETEFISGYYIGFYTELYGFLPFYSQRLPKATRTKLGKPILRDAMKEFSVKHYEELYMSATWNTLVAILTRIKDNHTLAISTVYGVDIPVNLEPVNPSTHLPVLHMTEQNWRKRLYGSKHIPGNTPVSIPIVLQRLQKLDTEHGILSPIEKTTTRRYIPYYFLHEKDVPHSIIALMIKVVLDSKVIRTVPIPIYPTKLTEVSYEDLRKQVGVREASFSTGSIRLSPELSLQTLLGDLNELRIRSTLPLGLTKYIFSNQTVIGVEDECGIHYILAPKQRFPLTKIDSVSKSFLLQPLAQLKHSFLQEVGQTAELQDILGDEFISLFSLPFWKDILHPLTEYAVSSNVWKRRVGDTMKILKKVEQELIKRRPDINKKYIHIYLSQWVASVSWNETLLDYVRHQTWSKTISIGDFKVDTNELMIESTDIDTFGDLYSSVIDTSMVPLSVVEIQGDIVPISGVESKKVQILPDVSTLGVSEEPKGGYIKTYSVVSYVECEGKPRDGLRDWILFSSSKTVATKLVQRNIVRAVVIE